MNPASRDSRPVHALVVRARWWPCNPLDGQWLAALRRAGLEPRELKNLRAAVTCDAAKHEFETQSFGALKSHWNTVYRALGQAARNRWRALVLALRIAAAPRAGPEDAWLRGTMADFQTPIADAERNYYRLRTVRCEWCVADDGRLVVPYALVREDPVARRHVLLSLCVMETTAETAGAIEALGGLVCAPRALSMPARAQAHNVRPDPAPHRAVVVPTTDVEDEGTERIPRVGRIVEVVPLPFGETHPGSSGSVVPLDGAASRAPATPPPAHALVLQVDAPRDADPVPMSPLGWGVGDGAFAFGLTPRAGDPFGLAVPTTPDDAQYGGWGQV